MGFADRYLALQGEGIISVSDNPNKYLGIIIIIPAFDESRLNISLDSLFQCTPAGCQTEVLVLINWPEDVADEIKKSNHSIYQQTLEWIAEHISEHIVFHVLVYPDMPAKHAGVGLARKTLMDEAVRRFNLVSRPEGIIVSFDADSICDVNYLQELEKHFFSFPEKDGCIVYFEHPVEGNDYISEVYEGAILYELHLRYYIESIRYTGYPNAFHAIGSSFAIKAEAYCRQGGMNRRKAGEDFYFLQKYFELGTFNELNTTRVIPSPRPSYRVPFGTGAAISRFVNEKSSTMLTYHPASFEVLKNFFEKIPDFYDSSDKEDISLLLRDIPTVLADFLNSAIFPSALCEIRKNSASFQAFEKRFFRWFNLFRILKFLNHSKQIYPDVPVGYAAVELLRKAGIIDYEKAGFSELLFIYRKWERGNQGV